MPTVRRRGLRRTPTDFSAIDAGERVRWSLGMIAIAGQFTPMRHAESPGIPVWPSWQAWAATYAACRDAYLAHYYQRNGPDEVPGAELLFAAFGRGENPGAVQMPQPPDPRHLLSGCGPARIFSQAK